MSNKGVGKTRKKAELAHSSRISEEKAKSKRTGIIQRQLGLLAGGTKDKSWGSKRKPIEVSDPKLKSKSLKKKSELRNEMCREEERQ
eukprot:747576-Hanusia_phi.AAC.4